MSDASSVVISTNNNRSFMLDAGMMEDIQRFREYAEKARPGTLFVLGMTVGGVEGDVKLYKLWSKENRYTIFFGYDTLCCTGKDGAELDIATEDNDAKGMTVDELLQAIEILPNCRVVMEYGTPKLYSTEKYEEYQVCRRACYKLWKREVENCYVCQEDAEDHKTLCGHSICIACYQKSIETSDCRINKHFTCGICRKEYIKKSILY